MPKNANPHEEHRRRVRKEFLANGFSDATPPHKILEMLLFYSIPRKDTNKIAHALLNRFGSISGVVNATPTELMSVDGIGENSIALIKLLIPVFRHYKSSSVEKVNAPTSMNSICDYNMAKYIGFTKEIFAVTSFNAKGEIVGFDTLNSGDVAYVGLSTRNFVEKVLERKATSVVISHNHPTGTALPSPSDVQTTKRIAALLATLGITLLDHIIVSNEDNDCISMAQTPEYHSIFD